MTIVNGIDTKEKFCKRNLTKSCMGISEDKYVAVYVARICEGKNHDTLIKAWEIVTQYEAAADIIVPVTGIENILEASYQTEIKNNINLLFMKNH